MVKSNKFAFVSVMFCFLAMGFVDLVGIASNFVKADLHLNDSIANTMPSLVFFWFLIFSVPTGVLMNKIGRRTPSSCPSPVHRSGRRQSHLRKVDTLLRHSPRGLRQQ